MLLYTLQALRLASFLSLEGFFLSVFSMNFSVPFSGDFRLPCGSCRAPVSERDCKGTPFFFTCKFFRNFFHFFLKVFLDPQSNTLSFSDIAKTRFSGFFQHPEAKNSRLTEKPPETIPRAFRTFSENFPKTRKLDEDLFTEFRLQRLIPFLNDIEGGLLLPLFRDETFTVEVVLDSGKSPARRTEIL